MSAPILHESDDWLVVDKPAGVVVVPARGETPEASLWRALEAARGERLWVVHRLDRETSGVVLFARGAAAHRAASLAFERREVRKRYRAWTRGAPPEGAGVVDTPLRPARRGKMQPAAPGSPGAKPARTRYRVERVWRRDAFAAARVEVEPATGRQHQIRVHLRSIGAPLLVDPRYGGRPAAGDPALDWPARLTLHACALELPLASGGLRVEAPVPGDLRALEAELDRVAGDPPPREGPSDPR